MNERDPSRESRRSPRRANRATVEELLRRLEAIEQRLGRIETGKPPPGDGRTTGAVARRPGRRCLGCGLPLRRRAGRCAWCGRPL